MESSTTGICWECLLKAGYENTMKQNIKSKEWFVENIGERVYRDSDDCECATCRDVVKNGLIIANEEHVEYLYMIQGDYFAEGIFLNYRNKK